MDYFQGVVAEYLRADRAVFLNTECCVQLNATDNPDGSGPHWYCDILAIDLRMPSVFLCEVSYSKSLADLLKRLRAWNKHWPELIAALRRDCQIPTDYQLRAWLFIPLECVGPAVKAMKSIGTAKDEVRKMPDPKITPLEMVTPWSYRSWSRIGEKEKPDVIPLSMR